MTQLNNLLFDVRKVDFKETFGMPTNSDYSHAIIGTIDGQDKILNVCSERYELLPNNTIFPVIREILDTQFKGDFEESYRIVNDSRFYADYKINTCEFEVGNGDIIYPKIQIQHSYNGLTKYAIMFGYFRLICSNGLVVPVTEKKELNLNITGKHTANIKTSFEQLKERLNYFVGNNAAAKQLGNNFNNLRDHTVKDWVKRVEEVMNVVKIGTTVNNKAYVENVILKEADQLNTGVNDWLIYNGINQLLNDDNENKKAPEVRQATDIKVIEALLTSQ